MSQAILYSFRRCPYAIRARLAIYHSGIHCELREVVLKNKPAQMLQASPKGTVPVVVVGDRVLDESIDIMRWALDHPDACNDPNTAWSSEELKHPLISRNDGYFKSWLDRYKYFDRYPEASQQYYFDQAMVFLHELEQSMVTNEDNSYALLTPNFSAIDAAILPFVRQFAFVNKPQFDALPLPKLLYWLEQGLSAPLFSAVMLKYPAWSPEQKDTVIFGNSE